MHHTAPKNSPLSQHSLDDLLSLAAQKYELEFVPVSAGGISLEIAQIKNLKNILDEIIASKGLDNALHTLPLWAKIWPASLILGHYLRHLDPEQHQGVLEVGAGAGVSGLVAAALGFKDVYITDINPDALLFAQINVLKNGLQEQVTVCHANVEKDRLGKRFSCIIGAEILYLEHLYRPLLKFVLGHLCAKSTACPHPEVLFCTDHRRDAKRFFKLAAKNFQIAHKPIGAKEKSNADSPAEQKMERHLLTLHRLTPFGVFPLEKKA